MANSVQGCDVLSLQMSRCVSSRSPACQLVLFLVMGNKGGRGRWRVRFPDALARGAPLWTGHSVPSPRAGAPRCCTACPALWMLHGVPCTVDVAQRALHCGCCTARPALWMQQSPQAAMVCGGGGGTAAPAGEGTVVKVQAPPKMRVRGLAMRAACIFGGVHTHMHTLSHPPTRASKFTQRAMARVRTWTVTYARSSSVSTRASTSSRCAASCAVWTPCWRLSSSPSLVPGPSPPLGSALPATTPLLARGAPSSPLPAPPPPSPGAAPGSLWKHVSHQPCASWRSRCCCCCSCCWCRCGEKAGGSPRPRDVAGRPAAGVAGTGLWLQGCASCN